MKNRIKFILLLGIFIGLYCAIIYPKQTTQQTWTGQKLKEQLFYITNSGNQYNEVIVVLKNGTKKTYTHNKPYKMQSSSIVVPEDGIDRTSTFIITKQESVLTATEE